MRLFIASVIGLGLLGVLGSPAGADSEAPLGTLEGRIVEALSLDPIEGATVIVTDTEHGPVVASGTTDPNGWFHYKVPPGTYSLVAIFGESRWVHARSKVERGKVTQVPGNLILEGETITVRDKALREHRPPEAIRATVKPILPYSDEAIDQNAWAVGWMLLDIDDGGIVTGFRFLHRPSYGLDAIAEKEIWSLRFKPARDSGGRAMESKVLWKLEWPSFHYAKDHKLLGLGGEGALAPSMEAAAAHDASNNHKPTADELNQLRADNAMMGGGVLVAEDSKQLSAQQRALMMTVPGGSFVLPDGDHRPPCRGSGPLNQDMHEALYRDCTPPDLSKVNTEQVIRRPAQKD